MRGLMRREVPMDSALLTVGVWDPGTNFGLELRICRSNKVGVRRVSRAGPGSPHRRQLLLLVHPASDRKQHETERIEEPRHV